MNINRLRPTEVDKDQLDLWLSGVINDALKDANDAGLDPNFAGQIAVKLGLMWISDIAKLRDKQRNAAIVAELKALWGERLKTNGHPAGQYLDGDRFRRWFPKEDTGS